MKRFSRAVLNAAFLFLATFSYAQERNEDALRLFREDPNRMALNRHVYEFTDAPLTPAPTGYVPFYISHYARHGARSSSHPEYYDYVIIRLEKAEAEGVLTEKGRYLLEKSRAVRKEYAGMPGRLTRRGEWEHRELAKRMYRNYPSVFKKGSRMLRIKSSTVPRVLVSAANCLSALTAIQPDLRYTFDTGERYMAMLNNGCPSTIRTELKPKLDSLKKLPMDTSAIYATLFTDGGKGRELVSDPVAFQRAVFQLACTSEPLGVANDLFTLLPEDARYKIWDTNVRNMYVSQCNSIEWGALRMERCEPLVRCILEDADDVLSGGAVAADLRFGHDLPLLALCNFLGLSGVGDRLSFDEIPFKWYDPMNIPFASNLQLVFYRPKKGGDILVKAVYNDRERRISGLTPVSGPYYKWEDLKAKCEDRISWRTFLLPHPAKITVGEGLHPCSGVETEIDSKLGREEYVLDTRGEKVRLVGGSDEALFRGEQTLRQIRNQHSDAAFPSLYIQDKPRFAWRGAMLDCCRHFWTVDEVKRFIDIMALHKLNVFHWHLTDDQGWRAEILKYPRLTGIGAMRSETLIGHARKSKVYDGTPYGGYYTQEEMREIVRYAAERYITVVPEIEMPGHALAALASYPSLGCTGGPYETATRWGVFNDIFCPGKDRTLEFLFDVLDEICEIFPSEYIHVGGDEAPRDRWKLCPDCQARISAESLDNEARLQSWLIRKVEQHLAEKGRKVIGWDEILDGGVEKTTAVMSWRGTAGGKRAASLGNPVIMAPNTHLYLDRYETDSPESYGEPLAIGGCIPLEKVYEFDPYQGLKSREKPFILGVQGNLWTEYVADFSVVEMRILPRLAALSEIAWSPAHVGHYKSFRERCYHAMLPLYEGAGWNYAPYAFADLKNLK